MQVETTKGLIDIDKLEIKDITTVTNNMRVTATEWRLGGELVRRDLMGNVLSGIVANGTQQDI
jgi:hypothetical protein